METNLRTGIVMRPKGPLFKKRKNCKWIIIINTRLCENFNNTTVYISRRGMSVWVVFTITAALMWWEVGGPRSNSSGQLPVPEWRHSPVGDHIMPLPGETLETPRSRSTRRKSSQGSALDNSTEDIAGDWKHNTIVKFIRKLI